MPLRFAPRWPFVVLTLAAIALFVWLGSWQYGRGVARAAVWQTFEKGGGDPQAATAASLATVARYTRIRLQGEWEADRQFLLDNMSHEGRPGYQVLTPLRLADGSHLLVNRGWVPFDGYRDRLPDIRFEATGVQTLTGRLGTLPSPGLASGRQPPDLDGPWPRVTSFPTPLEIGRALRQPVREPVLLLDPDSGPGYLRAWRPTGVAPDKHFSYAIQWWMFAAVAFGLFVSLNLKRVR